MRNILKETAEIFSAGSKPSGKVDETAIQVMKEININISNQKSKGFNDLPLKEFDYVVTMGCSETCPFIPAKKTIDWKIEDPKGKSIDFYRVVRDTIKRNILELSKKMEE